MIASILSTLAGAGTWTLAEHLIHHNLGHRYTRGKYNFFAQEHVRHHATTSYFAPSYKKAAAAAATTAAVGPVARLALGPRRGMAFTAGLVGMYVAYEVLHRRAHTHPPTNAYGRWMRKHHFYHHFHDPKVNHGVSAPWFDHLFGTHHDVGKVRVPEKHAMEWLVDPATGDVRAEFADDYELRRKKKRPAPVSEAPRAA